MLWKGNGECINMDEMSRGIATAALTLQSALLQALVAHGVMSPRQALDIVDLALEVSKGRLQSKAEKEVENVAVQCLKSVREGVRDMLN